MKQRKVIKRRIRHEDGNVSIAADISGVVAVNTGEPGSQNIVTSSQNVVVRQSGARRRKEDNA
jgi:hypothetical protein